MILDSGPNPRCATAGRGLLELLPFDGSTTALSVERYPVPSPTGVVVYGVPL